MKVGLPEKIKNFRTNNSLIVTTIILILIISGVLAVIFWSGGKKPNTTTQNTGSAPTSAELASGAQKAAQQSLSQKDYAQAANYYIEEAAQAQDNQKAFSILKQAVQQIPEASIPWDLYDSLANAAKAVNDKNLEISSLQKALSKAEQPNSGAGASIIDIYKQELKQLGVNAQ